MANLPEIFKLENDELTFAKLLGFYYRYTQGPDIESYPDKSPEWIAAFDSGFEEADTIDAADWDSAFQTGKAQAESDAAAKKVE